MIKIFETRIELYDKCLPKNGVGAELGVYKGENSIDLLKVTQAKKIYLCDPWHIPDDSYKLACENTRDYPQLEMVKAFDQDWLTTLPDKSLDWAYIDSAHTYEQTILEFQLLRSKVTQIITGHDLCCSTIHNNFADGWSAGVLRALLEVVSEGWLEVIAITQTHLPTAVADNFPSWACRVKE